MSQAMTRDGGTVVETPEQQGDAGDNWLFRRLPPEVLDSLDDTQRAALERAVTEQAWRRHTIDMRMSLPLFGRRFYLTMVGGQEKRDAGRRKAERNRYPLRTVANVFFFLGIATVFYAAALVLLAFQSTIIEF